MEVSPLSEKERLLLEALRGSGEGWHSRSALAARLGKNRLNPAEVTVLDVLVERGTIEKSLQATAEQPHVNQWVYRIK